jgi:hypothetical protein
LSAFDPKRTLRAVNNRSVAAKEMEGALDKTLKTVIAAALIVASLVSPSFAQSAWTTHVEKIMRQTLPKEAKCKRGGMGISLCDYDTPKFKIGFTGSDEGMLGVASAFVTMNPPITQEEYDVGVNMVLAFFRSFNFDQLAIRTCIGKGWQRDQWGPEVIKSTDKKFKLECYGSDTWKLVMKNNNEF